MGFEAPVRLVWLAAVAIFAAALFLRSRKDRALLGRLGRMDVIRTLIDPGRERMAYRMVLSVAALTLAVLAAARPQFGTKLAEIKRRGSEVFVAVDTSNSMLAEDISPSRMEKAKRALGFLIRQIEGDRVGIIAFSGDAFLQCPLTLDIDSARLFLDSAQVGMIPVPGTSLGAAILKALKHFPARGRAQKVVVLLTDGEDTGGNDPLAAAALAAKEGVRIYTIGLGTPEGEVIKLRDESGKLTGFKKDDKGETVLSRLDEATLIELARLTKGRYWRSSPGDGEMSELAEEITGMKKDVMEVKKQRVREDRYQIPLFLAFLLLVADFLIPLRTGHYGKVLADLRAWAVRIRGGRVGPGLLLALFMVFPAIRASADFRPNIRQGNQALKQGKLEEARQRYFNAQSERPESPYPAYNLGNTYYYEGNFEEALKFYDQAATLAKDVFTKSIVAYNRGCALYRLKKEEEAIEAFKEVLRLRPSDMDAKYNLEWIRSDKGRKQKESESDKRDSGGEKKREKAGMSKEDAERLLEMVKDQDKQKRDMKDRTGAAKEESEKGVKDW